LSLLRKVVHERQSDANGRVLVMIGPCNLECTRQYMVHIILRSRLPV
jgi:hypothetical protein